MNLLSTKTLAGSLTSHNGGAFCVQRFINFKGPKACFYRAVWNAEGQVSLFFFFFF